DAPGTRARTAAGRLPADGTYLVTGGAGALGSALARDLAGCGRPVLALTGRSLRPPPGLLEELPALGAHARHVPAPPPAPARPVLVLTGRSVRPARGLLEELTALGADARYVAADLTVPDEVERLVAGLPPLDAVFHAAGVVRPGSLRETDVADTLDVLAAKTA